MSNRRTDPITHGLHEAGEFLDELDERVDAATAIQGVTRAVEEDRDVAEVLKEEVSDDA